MREGIVLYDRNGEAIWACANVDARASREVAELKEIHDDRFESEVYEVSGQTLALSAMPRLLWLAHHRPDIYRKAATITMISDWLAAKLSGELAVDPSNAGTTGMLDLFSRDWRPALLDMAGLRADILSPVKETGSVLGAITHEAAQQSGLREGTPVVMGGGDVQLGCLGLGVVRAGQTAVLGGTFWQQVVNLPQVRTDPEIREVSEELRDRLKGLQIIEQRDRARLIGLSLALLMRLGLLSVMSWLITLTSPLITLGGFSLSGRDLILITGGLFLLFKATVELHERLEGRSHQDNGQRPYAGFWLVVAQIVALDAVFSLDAVITAVGMVNELGIMMAAVIIAMGVMVLASRPLTRFVNAHPTVVVLCLSFLLMIGLSLVAEGSGLHIPKGYLYAAIGFSILIESFNQMAHRNLVRQQAHRPAPAVFQRVDP